MTVPFRLWWSTNATPEQKSRLHDIAEDGLKPVDSDLVAALAQSRVLSVGSKWEGTNAGFDFHFTPGMYDIVLGDDDDQS